MKNKFSPEPVYWGNCRDSLGEFNNASYGVLGLRGLIGLESGDAIDETVQACSQISSVGQQILLTCAANFDYDSGFRVYFLFNSFAKHRSSNLQLLLDMLGSVYRS